MTVNAALDSDKCHTMSSASQDYLKQNYAVDAKSQWIIPKPKGTLGSANDLESDCNIRKLKSSEVAKCLTHKKILFFGDSMSRDIGMSLVLFLNQKDNNQNRDQMIGKHMKVAKFSRELCVCWGKDISGHTHTFGKVEAWKMYKSNIKNCALAYSYSTKSSEMWRVDIAHEGSYSSPMSWLRLEAMQDLFSYDLIILGNHGFHGIKKNILKYSSDFMSPLLKYSNSLLIDKSNVTLDKYATAATDNLLEGKKKVLKKQRIIQMPYLYLFTNTNYDDMKGPIAKSYRQSYLVEYINAISRDFLEKHSLPYFDNLFVTGYREASDDGVHLHRWANAIQVSLLMHYTCSATFEFKNHSIFQTP